MTQERIASIAGKLSKAQQRRLLAFETLVDGRALVDTTGPVAKRLREAGLTRYYSFTRDICTVTGLEVRAYLEREKS